jgi:hypothetical protein
MSTFGSCLPWAEPSWYVSHCCIFSKAPMSQNHYNAHAYIPKGTPDDLHHTTTTVIGASAKQLDDGQKRLFPPRSLRSFYMFMIILTTIECLWSHRRVGGSRKDSRQHLREMCARWVAFTPCLWKVNSKKMGGLSYYRWH